ncbi:SusF/SusE family outer membrane protein [Bacteroides propionicifaciens]|nr:SusF/SusE family outer membrane protein [Bacteroides propionicifaciens]
MVCIDGWGDDSNFNENGYRTKHSTHWEHDYAWWANFLKNKGLTLGIYNNPLWVNRNAASHGVKIKGTDIPLENIINREEPAKWFSWVQVEKEGAEEYVKGYIQYYADMGVKFLRVDFLSWFEDGVDRNADYSVPFDRPKEYYQTVLKWMKEACDVNGMTLSLVMPHLYNHAQNELNYAGGSMIRINDDVTDGGWDRFSDVARGMYHDIWPMYHNTFDGFIHWSDIAGFGKNKMILDGDFTRINTFRNNEEKKTAISLQLMAGAPIAITDQHNTIGDDLWIYQNKELLELNVNRFVGRPLSRDVSNPNSQIWKGQMPNGDWIVGLFNRENTEQVRSINFQQELGVIQGFVRDLWQHSDLEEMTSISETIVPHGCKIYKITANADQLMIVGDAVWSEWNLNNACVMLSDNNTVFTYTGWFEKDKEFKFITQTEWGKDEYKNGGETYLDNIGTLRLGGNDDKFKLPESGNYKITCSLAQLTITAEKINLQDKPILSQCVISGWRCYFCKLDAIECNISKARYK